MPVREVTVEYTITQNLGDYTNAKPSVRLVLDVPEGEAYAPDVLEELMAQARATVQAEVDAALEANDRPARYSDEPRYDVYSVSSSVQHRLTLIVPTRFVLEKHLHRVLRGARLQHARWAAATTYDSEEMELVDASADGAVAARALAAWTEREDALQAAREAERKARRAEAPF